MGLFTVELTNSSSYDVNASLVYRCLELEFSSFQLRDVLLKDV